MKKMIKGFIAGVSILSMATTAMAATFSDIKGTGYEWSLPYVEEMTEKGLISGYPDGTYKPEKTVSKLEALCLFAHAMGSNSESNAKALEYATEKHGEFVDSLELNFGKSEVAFMLYRGVLSETEAKAYLSGDVKNEAMLRYEAATIITKAMGGEAEAKGNLVFDLDYTDVSEIPATAKKYVYYVTDKGVMSGMTDGSFSPNTPVLRAQVAAMLKNTVDAMKLSFSEAVISSIDTKAMTISLEYADGQFDELTFSENTAFYLAGEKIQAKNVPTGVNSIVTANEQGVVTVDIESSVPDATIGVIFNSYSSKEGITYISATLPDLSEVKTYECVSGISNITKNGNSATIRDFKAGDYLELETSKGLVTSITGVDKDTTISSATIESISYDGANPTITISHADELYDGMSLSISDDVRVIKGGASANMTEVYRGDTVTLNLEYGIVVRVTATSTKKTVEGTIREVVISANPTITVLTNGEEVKYDVTSDIEIIVNGESATLYDFRVGSKVKLTTESSAVTKIECTAAQTIEGSLTGTVVAVNPSYNFIKLSVTDSTGYTFEESIYCKDSTTTFINAEGSKKLLRDVKEGSVITAFGVYTNGAFEATSVVIVK